MNKKTMLLLVIVLTSMIFISGCTQQTTGIKNQEEVSQAVTNVSTDVEDVATTLEDIDRKLGGG